MFTSQSAWQIYWICYQSDHICVQQHKDFKKLDGMVDIPTNANNKVIHASENV